MWEWRSVYRLRARPDIIILNIINKIISQVIGMPAFCGIFSISEDRRG